MFITKKKHTEILHMMKNDIVLQMKQAFRAVVDDQRSTILRLSTENTRLKFEVQNLKPSSKKRGKKCK